MWERELWTLNPFNIHKEKIFTDFMRKPENKFLKLHLDTLTEKDREIAMV